jgi:hypothetical protein
VALHLIQIGEAHAVSIHDNYGAAPDHFNLVLRIEARGCVFVNAQTNEMSFFKEVTLSK